MNQTPRIRKGKCMFCGSEVNIFQVYYTLIRVCGCLYSDMP